MRNVLIPGLAMGFATMACAAATRPDELAQAPAGAGQSEQGAIIIREQSNVCVWVHVDQRIWPRPLSAYTKWSFSNLLATELGLRYQQQGGTLILPGRTPEGNLDPRFVANVDGGSRLCRRDSDDIYVTVRYLPRPDGGAFAADYRIEQGRHVSAGRFARDLAAELRIRNVRAPENYGPISQAIAFDVRSRADMLFAQLR